MTTKTIYIAHDGTTFNSECECVDYEKHNRGELLRTINLDKRFWLPTAFESYMNAKKTYQEAMKHPKNYKDVYHAAEDIIRCKRILYIRIKQYKANRALLKEVNETEKYW